MPTWSIAHSDGEISREVVIAVAQLTDTVVATNDDIGLESLPGTESPIESVGGTGVDFSSGVVCVLSAGKRSRGDEESSVHHFEFGVL